MQFNQPINHFIYKAQFNTASVDQCAVATLAASEVTEGQDITYNPCQSSGSSILNCLKAIYGRLTNPRIKGIAVIQPCGDKTMYYFFKI